MAAKWKTVHPDEDPISRWVRGETKFEVLVLADDADSEWWWMTLKELEEQAKLAIEHGREKIVTFTIPMVTGKGPELSPDEVLKLALRIRRKRW